MTENSALPPVNLAWLSQLSPVRPLKPPEVEVNYDREREAKLNWARQKLLRFRKRKPVAVDNLPDLLSPHLAAALSDLQIIGEGTLV